VELLTYLLIYLLTSEEVVRNVLKVHFETIKKFEIRNMIFKIMLYCCHILSTDVLHENEVGVKVRRAHTRECNVSDDCHTSLKPSLSFGSKGLGI
jgi:hypothetical protein